MTDPPRLFEATNDAFERKLLDSARRDRGSHSAQARCAAAVSAAAIAASKAGIAAATASSAGTVTAAAAPIGVGVLVKAVAIGLTVGLAAQGSYVVGNRVLSRSSAPLAHPRHTPPRSATSGIPVIESSLPLAAPPIPSAIAVAQPVRMVQARPSGIGSRTEPLAPQPTPSTPEHIADDSLEREVALLDDARHACQTGVHAQALQLLDRHAAEFPSGALGPEAVVLRVRALLGLGRRSDAETIAQKYTAFHPNSAAAKRLEMLIGSKSK